MLKSLLTRARKDGLAGPPQDVDDHDQNPQALQPNFVNNQENPDDQHQEQRAGLGANHEDEEQLEDPIPNAERDIFDTVWVSKKRRNRKRKRRSFEGFYLPCVLNNNTRITGSFEDEKHQVEASSSERKYPSREPSSDEQNEEENDNIDASSEEGNEIEEDESEQNEGGNHDDELEDEDNEEDEGNRCDESGSDSSWRLSDQSDDDDDDF